MWCGMRFFGWRQKTEFGFSVFTHSFAGQSFPSVHGSLACSVEHVPNERFWQKVCRGPKCEKARQLSGGHEHV